jgi:type I restriction enzyme, S subunit
VTMAPITIELGEVMATKSGSVEPSKFSQEAFDLYSIPAFDRGEPEIAIGAEIGSAKQIVEPGDVLLSKIVPHIRRSWVVGPDRGRRLIASGEWIVFRSARVHPPYLRHVLIGDPFHAQFMRTVSGVGGSLLRARPSYVASIRVPFPSLPEQRRIAEILDKADALRAKRRTALAQLDTLTQSIFLDMFGDPATNPKMWPRRPLGELIAVGPQNGVYKPAEEYGTGTRILRIDAFYDGVVTDLNSLKRVRLSAPEQTLYALREGEIVINRVNSREYLGKSALIPPLSETTVFESNMMRFGVARDSLEPVYLIQYLQTGFVRAHINKSAKDAVNQSSINQQDVKAIPIVVPPMAAQQLFSQRLSANQRLKGAQGISAAELDSLFASLQDRAFQGEL